MDRKELSNNVFKIIREDFIGQKKEIEIWKAIAETSDDELYKFWGEKNKNK